MNTEPPVDVCAGKPSKDDDKPKEADPGMYDDVDDYVPSYGRSTRDKDRGKDRERHDRDRDRDRDRGRDRRDRDRDRYLSHQGYMVF